MLQKLEALFKLISSPYLLLYRTTGKGPDICHTLEARLGVANLGPLNSTFRPSVVKILGVSFRSLCLWLQALRYGVMEQNSAKLAKSENPDALASFVPNRFR